MYGLGAIIRTADVTIMNEPLTTPKKFKTLLKRISYIVNSKDIVVLMPKKLLPKAFQEDDPYFTMSIYNKQFKIINIDDVTDYWRQFTGKETGKTLFVAMEASFLEKGKVGIAQGLFDQKYKDKDEFTNHHSFILGFA